MVKTMVFISLFFIFKMKIGKEVTNRDEKGMKEGPKSGTRPQFGPSLNIERRLSGKSKIEAF